MAVPADDDAGQSAPDDGVGAAPGDTSPLLHFNGVDVAIIDDEADSLAADDAFAAACDTGSFFARVGHVRP